MRGDLPAKRRETAELLRAAMARLNRRLRAQEPAGGAGSTGLSALGALYRLGPSSIGELAAHERLQPQSLTRTIVDLEERGYLTRSRDEIDKRRFRVAITPAGEARLRESVRLRDAWFALAIERELSVAECDVLRIAAGLLERIAETATARDALEEFALARRELASA